MKFWVTKQFLLITAGIVWVIAGGNILRIGIVTWNDSHFTCHFMIFGAIAVFLLFFVLVFRKLFYKHTRRIENKKDDKNCPFGFFDTKGWIIMVLMITFGIIVRTFRLLPDSFISVFYTGLGLALIYTGILFIRYRWQRGRHQLTESKSQHDKNSN